MPEFSYQVLAKCSQTKARAGIFSTPHGIVAAIYARRDVSKRENSNTNAVRGNRGADGISQYLPLTFATWRIDCW